ncbi:MAG: DUF4178 domain-containing protein [Burkholderiales bacterium]|nr:DUF4178 domain-containing protein [Burkholderiales bacterium]
MQQVSCPGCGAPVAFKSHASVLAVCEFCSTTVLKDADSIKDLGKMSAVLEDYSPLQIGTSGRIGGRSFTLIGRIQLRYEAGMWNEWYVLFDDGSNGWLGDSSGMFTFTFEREVPQDKIPPYSALAVGKSMRFEDKSYLAAEIRTGECIGGQGELPFKVGQGYEIEVADFRAGKQFLTLDYSDDKIRAYVGQAVTLPALECQLLREDDQIKESASKFKGKVGALDCPSCGSPIKYAPGVSKHIICGACHAQIDASTPKAEVLAAGDAIAAVKTTLELGAKAKINGVEHQIIGLMKREDDEGEEWVEYLMYSSKGGFIWLVETNSGWAKANVMEDWPDWDRGENAKVGQQQFKKLYDYDAEVTFAIGAFNWRVNVGDTTKVIEFSCNQNKLAAEMTDKELTWSMSTPVAADQIRAWFGQSIEADKASADGAINPMPFIYWLLGLNAIPFLLGASGTWFVLLLSLAAIYFPAQYFNNKDKS